MNETKPHLLIYAHYYDLASTARIIRDLAEGLLDTFTITVICVVPSYLGTIEDKWKTRKYYRENINGVDVIRIGVPEFAKTDKFSRIRNILVYFLRAAYITGKVGKVDYVLSVSQPPILGGLLGVWGKLRKKGTGGKRAKYIYQIQDFNPEQAMTVNYCKNSIVTGLMMALDKYSCRKADLIITVGRDLMETLEKRFKHGTFPKALMINTWTDEKVIFPLPPDNKKVLEFRRKYGLSGRFVIMYSGNIGLYYDLENLIKVIAKFGPGTVTEDGREVVFVFAGAGTVLNKLVFYKERHGLDNVIFIPYQPEEELIYSLNAGDIQWCVNAKGMKGVSCPSKYYGLAAAGRPVLGVLEKGTEVRFLIEKTGGGLCCDPGEYKSIEKNIRWFIENAGSKEVYEMGIRGRRYLEEKLTKDSCIRKYRDAILHC